MDGWIVMGALGEAGLVATGCVDKCGWSHFYRFGLGISGLGAAISIGFQQRGYVFGAGSCCGADLADGAKFFIAAIEESCD